MRVFTDLYIKVALIFMLLVNCVTSPRRVERIGWVIVLAFGYVSLRACVDYASGTNLYEGNRIGGAAGGFFENPRRPSRRRTWPRRRACRCGTW